VYVYVRKHQLGARPVIDLEHEPANIPASDDKGHNVGLSTRVPAAWLRQIDDALKNRDLPYFNKADFVRDAVFKHLKFITDWTGDSHNSDYYGIAALVQNQLSDKTHEEFDKLMAIMDKNILTYTSLGDARQASQYLNSTLHAMDKMPDSYWKGLYIKKIKEKYAGLLGMVPCALFD
jgi:hypothetical protein